jgi:predicted nucleotidyltransferase
MKLDFDISTIDYKIIHEILTRYLNSDYTIWVFGSRVKNQTKYNSDLDLAVEYKNKIDIKLLRKIKRELEESKLPFKVDILDLNATSEEFNALIKKDMIPFPLKFLDKVPKLRFKEFSGEWEEKRADYLLDRYSNPVEVNLLESYRQIGTRSHGKGIFHKESVTGKELGNKRVFWVHEKALVINIVFAWEHSIALTSESEKGFIASHRFPMYLPKENRCNLNFILEFFLRKYGKHL